jgi:aryl-phospho-beta-D-glucosidase BglC (GH1 family)
MAFVVKDGPMRVNLTPSSGLILPGQRLAENWLLLAGGARDILVVLERQPEAVLWHPGEPRLSVGCDHGPVRAALLVMPQGVKLDDAECRWWARALRAYPVTATEMVKPGNPQTCWIRYNYLHLDGFGDLAPLDVAPVPMLFSYGLRHEHPGLAIRNARTTSYHSQHAPYRVVENSVVVEYQAPPVDRSKVKKGVGELFAKRKAEHNVRGGLSEDERFRRMGEWGFDHCRYAWAFQADWDLPLVKFVGGPVIEDNEATWKRLDELVDKCNAAGMQMMLCWFFNEDQPQKDTGGAVRNSTRYWRAHPEAQRNAFELWRRIAARYADRPGGAIAYDFFNEPAYINTDHWNEIIRELTKIIRSVDKKHLIVWESADGWAQPQWCSWMEPAKDPNVLYSFHHYGKHWGYGYDEYYPSYRCTTERSQIDPWLDAILFSIKHHVPIHCGEFGISMIQPEDSGERWLNDYLAMFERFGIGWNWWNYAGDNIYRTGLAAGNRISPYVPILRKWMGRRGPQ